MYSNDMRRLQTTSKGGYPLGEEMEFQRNRKFLGFSFYRNKDRIRIRIHDESVKRFKEKVREITNRNKGVSMEYRIERLNQVTTGWVNYFGLADAKGRMKSLDEWIRQRLTAVYGNNGRR